MGDIFEVQEILSSRQTADGGSEYKIRWKGFGPSGDTWEPEENLIHCEEILDAYKKNMAEQSTWRRNKTPLKTPVTSRMSAFANKHTTRSSTVPAKDKEATPILQRTRLRQRNTPKVQRVLGVKQLPSQVNLSAVSMEKPEMSNRELTDKISCERPVKCNKWAIFGGLLCILTSVFLLYVSVDRSTTSSP